MCGGFSCVVFSYGISLLVVSFSVYMVRIVR